MARRYIVLVQDGRGYSAPGSDLDPAPPDGPAPPMMLSAVLADDYEELASRFSVLEGERDRAVEALRVLVEELDQYSLWEPGRKGHAAAYRRLVVARNAARAALESLSGGAGD